MNEPAPKVPELRPEYCQSFADDRYIQEVYQKFRELGPSGCTVVVEATTMRQAEAAGSSEPVALEDNGYLMRLSTPPHFMGDNPRLVPARMLAAAFKSAGRFAMFKEGVLKDLPVDQHFRPLNEGSVWVSGKAMAALADAYVSGNHEAALNALVDPFKDAASVSIMMGAR